LNSVWLPKASIEAREEEGRDLWWLGLRDVEKERYTAGGANLKARRARFSRVMDDEDQALQITENRTGSDEECYQD